MLKSTLPFSKASARCWAGTPVSESYLQGWVGLGGVPWQQARVSDMGCGQGRPLPPGGWRGPGNPIRPDPYHWKSSPRLRAGVTKRASRRQSWL